MARLAERLGYLERQIDETDLITMGLGIAVGGLLGTLAIRVGGLSLGLGSAGGLLGAGLIVGYLRSIRPTFLSLFFYRLIRCGTRILSQLEN